MKKSLVLMAMAGVALASCVNDVAEVAQNQEQKKVKIAFDAPVLYDNSESRAQVYGEIGAYDHNGGQNTVTYPKNEKFIIYAIRHTEELSSWPENPTKCSFYGQAISYDESLDGWAPKTTDNKYIYWPTDEKLSFAATSPADLEQPAGWIEKDKRTFGRDGLTITDFTVPGVGKQYDLLYTEADLNNTIAEWSSNPGDETTYEGFPIKFYHALSSIHIAISKDLNNDNNIVLTSVKLEGVEGQGTFKSQVSSGTKNWVPTGSSKVDYQILKDGTINFPFVGVNGAGMHITELTGGDRANYLLIMPQDLIEGVNLKVSFTINGSPQNKTIKLNDVDENPLTDNTVNEWVMGKRYTYHLHISGSSSSLKPIFFAPSTEGWTDGGTITINL